MTDAEPQGANEELAAQDDLAADTEGQKWRHRNDTPAPPKDTGAGATESDDDDAEGQMPARYR